MTTSDELKYLIKEAQADRPGVTVRTLLEELRPRVPSLTAKLVRRLLKQIKVDASLETLTDEPPKAPILVVPFEDVEIATILPYKLVSIPGKGKGLVASRPISAGECLFNEEPLLALDSDEERRGDLFQARYEAMDDDKRKRYESLCDKSRNQATPKGIWETNAVVMGLSFDSGVFETYSRLNHSCRPNVMNNWDSKTQRLYVHALCDIAVGEELTTAYVDVLLRRKERQEILKGHYAFECTCKACVATKEEVLQSDTRRIWLSYFDQSMSQEGLMAKPFQNLAKIEKAIGFLNEERLYGLKADFSGAAYHISYRLSKLSEAPSTLLRDAKHWAALAYQHGRISYGEQDERVKAWKEWAISPCEPRDFAGEDALRSLLGKAGRQ